MYSQCVHNLLRHAFDKFIVQENYRTSKSIYIKGSFITIRLFLVSKNRMKVTKLHIYWIYTSPRMCPFKLGKYRCRKFNLKCNVRAIFIAASRIMFSKFVNFYSDFILILLLI